VSNGRGSGDAGGLAARGRSLLPIAYLATFGVLLLFVIVVSLFGSSRDGDPSLSLAISPEAAAANADVKVPVTPAAQRKINSYLVADPALLEATSAGLLPKIGADGRKPRDAYAGAWNANDTRPRVALVIRDLGIGAGETSVALSNLPAGITLAFAPYSQDIQSWVDKARGAGHEVLLELPMEPLDFPNSDPGPRALLVGASADENGKRMNWALSRATGYVGFANLMGSRFLGEAAPMNPVFATLASRGLMFFDDGASPRSLSAQEAREHDVPLAASSLTVDEVQAMTPIDEKLATLEQRARETGFAVGVGSPFPVTIDRVATWAQNLAMHGIALVPVSAIAKKPAGAQPAAAP
jgi:hypothetical protein